MARAENEENIYSKRRRKAYHHKGYGARTAELVKAMKDLFRVCGTYHRKINLGEPVVRT